MAETGVCSLWMWNWAIANFYKPYSFLHISSNQKVYLTIHSFYRLILNNFCCYLEYFPPWPINSIYSIAWHTCNAYRLPLFIFALIEKWRKRRGDAANAWALSWVYILNIFLVKNSSTIFAPTQTRTFLLPWILKLTSFVTQAAKCVEGCVTFWYSSLFAFAAVSAISHFVRIFLLLYHCMNYFFFVEWNWCFSNYS